MATYHLQAYTEENGQKIDQSTPEFVGINNEYDTLDGAIKAALDFEGELEDVGLPASTVYTVHDLDGEQLWSTAD